VITARGRLRSETGPGFPRGAAEIRAHWRRLREIAFAEALARDPTLQTRYDERMLRLFYRDYEGHFTQLARALESGSDEVVRLYGEWLVPLLRRRRVPTADFVTLIAAMAPAARSVLTPEEDAALQGIIERWIARQRRARKIPGDRRRNPLLRFFWKGVGIAD
jgi:hypothetical protein